MIRQRAASDNDRSRWFAAAEVASKPPAMTTREGLIRELQHRNPVRMHRIRGDFKWMKKQMVKLGLNPEDARWLL